MAGLRTRAQWTCLSTILMQAMVVSLASAQPSVTVNVSSPQVEVGVGFSIIVSETGENIGQPSIPEVDGLRINRDSPGKFEGRNISIINGRMSSILERRWTYTAWPMQTGKLVVPRIAVEVDGKSYLTQELIVTAKERQRRSTATPSGASGNTARRGAQAQSNANRTLTLDDAFFIESAVDKETAYQGEPIRLTLSIWELNGYGIRGESMRNNLPMPSTEGFYNGPIVEDKETRVLDGLEYSVKHFNVFVYPTDTGTQTIGSWEWDGYVRYRSNNSLFGRNRERKRYQTPPIAIEVKPLPPQPAEFTGAVGEFSITADLRNKDALQGLPLQYVVQVAGQGNPDAIGALALPEMSWAHVSEPETRIPEIDPADTNPMLKEFTYQIVPLEIGDQEIPALQFSYFSPAAHDYRVTRIPETPVLVKGSGESETLVAFGGTQVLSQRAVQILSEDVLPIMTSAGSLGPHRSSFAATGLVTVLPPLFYMALFLYCRQSRRLTEDTEYARKHLARSKGEKRLSGMENAEDPAASLYQALIGFLADKFNINEAGLTSRDAEDALKNRGIDGKTSDNLVKVLKTCERARYAGTALSSSEIQALKHGAIAAMDQFEAVLKKGERR